ILLPALGNARDSARTMRCASNLKQLGLATAMYVNDHDYSYMTNNFETGSWDYKLGAYDGRGTPPTLSSNFFAQIAAGADWATIYACPSDEIESTNPNLFYRRSYTFNEYRQDDDSRPGFVGYDVFGSGAAISKYDARNETEVLNASKALTITDYHRDNNRINNPEIVSVFRMWFVTPANPGALDNDQSRFPHSDGIMNSLYADGHVELVDRFDAARSPSGIFLGGNATGTQFDAAN
ncbi:MAG: DUF1559 domain-containing protein, partial [Pseudomonadota bacterium]